jgi:hypothetical protein
MPIRLCLIISLCSFPLLILAQKAKEQQFRSTLEKIVTAFSDQDSLALSKFVHAPTGVYLLGRTGVFDHYWRVKFVGFSSKDYPQVLAQQSRKIQWEELKYETLPAWSCETEAWNKQGLFVDTGRIDHMLSRFSIANNKNQGTHTPLKTIRYFQDLENKSRRIVLVDKTGKELVIYLGYFQEKWYLTIVDFASSDCSA